MNPTHHHLLYVEDNHDDALLIQRVFKKMGNPCTVSWMEDGAAALAYLKGEGEFEDRQKHRFPTLALLDIKLPRYTGLEVLEWIRSQGQLSALPVIMFSSSRNLEDIRRAYDLGANAYLVKAVGYDELTETLKTLAGFWLGKNVLPL